jgi:UDP-glucose 4-epimerase
MTTPLLITGAGGFIGSHLVEDLVNEGFKVRALVRYQSTGSIGWLNSIPIGLRNEIEIVHGDIRDTEFVTNICKGIDKIVNLAALIAIPYSYSASRSYVETNVIGTLNILEASKIHNCQLVQISTSEVYGTPSILPITEQNELRPQSPYAATKVGADKLVESYVASFGLEATILRPFNTFGPRQSMRGVISNILLQIAAGFPTLSIGNLLPRRDFTFVSDTVVGIRKAIQYSPKIGETIQLGTGVSVSIGELIEVCKSITGSSILIEDSAERHRPPRSEVEVLLSNPSKAKLILDWSPTVSLEEGLSETYDWILQNLNLYSETNRYHV